MNQIVPVKRFVSAYGEMWYLLVPACHPIMAPSQVWCIPATGALECKYGSRAVFIFQFRGRQLIFKTLARYTNTQLHRPERPVVPRSETLQMTGVGCPKFTRTVEISRRSCPGGQMTVLRRYDESSVVSDTAPLLSGTIGRQSNKQSPPRCKWSLTIDGGNQDAAAAVSGHRRRRFDPLDDGPRPVLPGDRRLPPPPYQPPEPTHKHRQIISA